MKLLFMVMFLLFSGIFSVGVSASGNGVVLDSADIRLDDHDAIRRGAKLFVDYCLNCHSAALMRYSRIAQDLDMSSDEVSSQLITTGVKVGEVMKVSMIEEDAKLWFGMVVPDLSVVARARGVDWLYTYLRSFYRDDSRPWGVNNSVFKDVGMPHVLWKLQGLQVPVMENHTDAQGNTSEVISGFKLVEKGTFNSEEYDAVVRDLVTFLAYLGEPSKLQRLALGKWVLLFLAGLLVLTFLLKKEYWRDIH